MKRKYVTTPALTVNNNQFLYYVLPFLDYKDLLMPCSIVCKRWREQVIRYIREDLVKDFTQGLESVPIKIEMASFSQYLIPKLPIFVINKYVTRSIDPSELSKLKYYPGCKCIDECNTSCECAARMNNRLPFEGCNLKEEYLVQEENQHYSNETKNYDLSSICYFECNSQCNCILSKHTNCNLKVTSKGMTTPNLELFYSSKGWGVRYGLQNDNELKPIKRGSFICEYAGEYISTKEAKYRQKNLYDPNHINYLLVLCEHIPVQHTNTTMVMRTNIDGTRIGNVARFFNHSCDPSLIPISIRTDSLLPRVYLFARKDILPGDELTFDYGLNFVNEDMQVNHNNRFECHCGSIYCKKWLPFDPNV